MAVHRLLNIATIIDIQYYFLCFLLYFLSALLLMSFFKTKTPLNLPPSPPAIPIICHLHLLGPSLFQSFHNLSNKYGPLLYLRLGASRCLSISTASMATEIFKTNDLVFANRPSFAFVDKLPYKNYGIFVAPYGDCWRFFKKLCKKELLSAHQVEKSRDILREEMIRFLHKVLESGKKKQVLDMSSELMKLTNNSTCRVVMSIRCSDDNDEAEKIRQLVKETREVSAKASVGDVLGPLRFLSSWFYGKQAIDVILRYDEILESVLKQHEENPNVENEDFVDILLKVYRGDKAEFKINRTHLKAFLLDLFVGGTATTAETLQWTIAELINHPDVFNKVREEIKVVVDSSRLVEDADITSLPYLQAVVKEVLRLHPPWPIIIRECRQDCKIKDFDILEKTMVAINVYTIMRDANVWNCPNDFCPERFLVSFEKEDVMKYIPFGAGRRVCPGSKLALGLVHTTIAAMVQCFDWKVGGEEDHAKVNMQVGPGITKPMAQPLLCLPVVHFNPFTSSF